MLLHSVSRHRSRGNDLAPPPASIPVTTNSNYLKKKNVIRSHVTVRPASINKIKKKHHASSEVYSESALILLDDFLPVSLIIDQFLANALQRSARLLLFFSNDCQKTRQDSKQIATLISLNCTHTG